MSHSRTRTFIQQSARIGFGLALASFSALNTSYADTQDESTGQLDEIVVTAFRLPTDANKTGSSVYVLNQDQIKNRGHIYLTDALASIPGVTVNQNGPFGGQASARIRGASSDQTLVMIDGIIVNDTSTPGGGFNFGTIELTDIERIEVLKGPQSTLWGSDAIGGVINIVSKQSSDSLNGQVGLTAGSFGTQQYRGVVSAGNNIADFRINVSDTHSDGISKADEDDGNTEEDEYDAQTIALKLGINLTDNIRLQVNHRQTETESEFDSFGVATGVIDGDELSEVDRSTSHLKLTIPAFDGRLTNSFIYARSDIERDNFTDGAASFSSEGERRVFQYQGTWAINETQQLSMGFEDEESEANANDSDIQGLYALYQVSPRQDLTISMGLRQDDHSEFGNETVGRISVAWEAMQSLDVQASWGEGFKAPTIFQTTFFCCGATAPNPNLVAETSDAFDLGFTWRFADQASLALTYFNQKTENQIDFSFALGGYENIAEVDSKGLELSLLYQINESIFTETNISYINSEDVNGDELVRVPELTADLSLTWQVRDNLRSVFALVHNGDEEDSRGTVDSWTRIDLSAVWEPTQDIEVFARIENITDKDYQQIFGYGTPERSGYIGMSYRF